MFITSGESAIAADLSTKFRRSRRTNFSVRLGFKDEVLRLAMAVTAVQQVSSGTLAVNRLLPFSSGSLGLSRVFFGACTAVIH
jgi:hypothetical protein